MTSDRHHSSPRQSRWHLLWTYAYIAVAVLPGSAGKKFACGKGPHKLENVDLDIYVTEGTATVLTTKNISQLAVQHIRWWTEPDTKQSAFDRHTVMTETNTHATLTMRQELNDVKVGYCVQYTKTNGQTATFTSRSATLKLGDARMHPVKDNTQNTSLVRGLSQTIVPVSCFNATNGPLRSIITTNVSIKNNLYPTRQDQFTLDGDCVEMGPLIKGYTGYVYVVTVENCFSTTADIRFLLQVEASTTLPPRAISHEHETEEPTVQQLSAGVQSPAIQITSIKVGQKHQTSTSTIVIYANINCQVTVAYNISGTHCHVTVQRNKHTIKTSNRILISLSNFTISPVTTTDFGNYTLTVRNENGASTTEFTIKQLNATNHSPTRAPMSSTTNRNSSQSILTEQDEIASRKPQTEKKDKTGRITTPYHRKPDRLLPEKYSLPKDNSTVSAVAYTTPTLNDAVATRTSGVPVWTVTTFVLTFLLVTVIVTVIIYKCRKRACRCITRYKSKHRGYYWTVEPSQSNTTNNYDVLSSIDFNNAIISSETGETNTDIISQPNRQISSPTSTTDQPLYLPNALHTSTNQEQVTTSSQPNKSATHNHEQPNPTYQTIHEHTEVTQRAACPASQPNTHQSTETRTNTKTVCSEQNENDRIIYSEIKQKTASNKTASKHPTSSSHDYAEIDFDSPATATNSKIRPRSHTVQYYKRESVNECNDPVAYATLEDMNTMKENTRERSQTTLVTVSDLSSLYAKVNKTRSSSLSVPHKFHSTTNPNLQKNDTRQIIHSASASSPSLSQTVHNHSQHTNSMSKDTNHQIETWRPKPPVKPKPYGLSQLVAASNKVCKDPVESKRQKHSNHIVK
ncbi:mucin-2-like isoform X2 [Corticium candelabrum]|uniref:mucin-2-like isoform X2 n=1 Tax=Corticium candelabrum TaxID=121492 RepID=UPI002E25B9EE|nr:mucin-2-like isoform X2 [Corticium candelabrum]